MHKLRKLASAILLFLIVVVGYSQQYSNLRKKMVVITDSIIFDTLSIVPGSEILRDIKQQIMPDSLYHINYSKSTLYTKNTAIKGKQILITYRVFPYNFSKPYPEHPVKEKTDTLKPNLAFSIYTPLENQTNEEPKLHVNGNISRGASVGNAQNLVVNSNLNLQLTGELSEGLYIEALLSDKNIPVQPDGYTQQIQEFDQVYIRLFDSIRSLQMGDVEINSSKSHFLKFNRRILGGNFTNRLMPLSKNTTATAQISAAVSKGSFNRTPFLGIEGIQGPYPLKGANNETYIIILAGTEKIYLDGVLLERGENADYVINYNTAELTFTPKHFITKNSRIIAEFEYSDKNYNRFIFYAQGEVKHKNNTYSIQIFTEGDAKNQPVNQLLTDEHKHILANAGDNPMQAIVPNYDSIAFNKNMVFYKITDTIVNGITYDSVLVYSTNPDSAFYRAGFAMVGKNRGNYIQDITPANGKVFKWLAPVNGILQGNYEPIQLLIAPKKQQMFIAKSSFNINARTKAVVELAFSQKDINTFSDIDNTDNRGMAVKNYIEHTIPMQTKSLTMGLTYEMAQKHFNPIERYRNPEFKRDWNLTSPIFNDEHFLKADISLNKKKTTKASLITEFLDYGSEYRGYRNSLFTNFMFYKFTFTGKASLLNTTTLANNTQFYRHNLKLVRHVWKIKLGVSHDFEDNQQKSILTDSLLLLSKKHSLAEAFISNSDSSKNKFSVTYRNRTDFLPFKNKLTPTTQTNDVIFNSQLGTDKRQSLKSSIIWRNLQIKNSQIDITKKNEQNLLARVDHQLKLNKRVLSFFTFYEISTGMETRKEFSYIEVAAGQGIYVWVDYNNNDIPELNEFEVSPFPEEANYLKIYTPTNDYIKIYSLRFNETIKLDPGRVWRNKEGIKKFISRFNNTFTFRAQQKHTSNDLISRINPFPGYVNDTSQINRNVSFRNTFSFNRTNPKFGADYIFNHQNRKTLLTNGFDASENSAHTVKLRWNITTNFLLLNNAQINEKTYSSEFFTNKNYIIEAAENSATLQWQPTTKFRFSVIYKIKSKINKLGYETALLQEAGPEIKINSPKQGMVSAKVSIILNNYNGEPNAPVTYSMLEGYQPGENYRWSVNFSRNINKFLRLSLSYNGRKPAETEIIHTGQFSLSAFF